MTDRQPDEWGLLREWVDADERPMVVADATMERVRRIVGRQAGDLDERAPIVTVGDGTLPLGYHWVDTESGERRRLVVTPQTCYVPDKPMWGWVVQLYGVRSAGSWGIGDFADLRTIREWAQSQGAGFLVVNPLLAAGPVLPQEPSPYLPSSRRFLNPIYVRPDEVPGYERTELEDDARALNAAELVDRDRTWVLKDRALRHAYQAGAEQDEFERWRGEQGEPLETFATWCALSVEHGADWRTWPEAYRSPELPEVGQYAERHGDEVRYHAWLQWVTQRQLAVATGALMVVQDLPIGISGGGADAWCWQELIAQGVEVGAPPDQFNKKGQAWGAPPMVPWRMRGESYEAFRQTIHATISATGGLRIDHVMGLWRLWWVPEGSSAQDGVYVRYAEHDLLGIVALESQRARAVVVGEDLGTVDEEVRRAMADRGLLSYRLLWFEEDPPERWPELALAAVTTHDLPTVAGLWTGVDTEEQVDHGAATRDVAEEGAASLRERLQQDGLADDASPEEAVLAAYTLVARSPCLLKAVTLEDVAAATRRPNLPGTTDRPNWCIPLPLTLEEILTDERAAALAKIMGG